MRSVPACYGDQTSADALVAAEAWVKELTETNREVALSESGKHNFEMPTTPAAWTAMAAGWTSGVPATGEEDVLATPKHLTAHAVAGAILLAGTSQADQAGDLFHGLL